jgi:hypothetical protein
MINWYKISQANSDCKSLQKKILDYNNMDSNEWENYLLEWSRCIRVAMDPEKTNEYRMPNVEQLMEYIARGKKVVRTPETIKNISKWYGSACMVYLSTVVKLFKGVQFTSENLKSINSGIIDGDWSHVLPFWLADKESIDRVLEFTKTPDYNSALVAGSWVCGVMNNPNASHELQKKIVDDMVKNKKLFGYSHMAEVAVGLMCNPNGNQDAIKPMLSGGIIHSNSTLVKMIDDNKTIFNKMWSWRSAYTGEVTPNESVLKAVSEYINNIVSQWHSSMFDSIRGTEATNLYPVMELLMWMNVYSKNPETVRRNYDTYQKAMLIKARPNEDQSPVSKVNSGGLVLPASYLANNLIMSFVMRQSELKDEEVQQLVEILIKHHLETHASGVNISSAGITIAPLILSLNSFDTRAGIEGSHLARMSGNFTNTKLKKSFYEALKRFNFKALVEKIKKNPNEFIDAYGSQISNTHMYSVRLNIVKSLVANKGTS